MKKEEKKSKRKFSGNKAALWAITLVSLFVGYEIANGIVQNFVSITVEAPKGRVLFVSQDSPSSKENGSVFHPFKEIGSAAQFASENPAFDIIVVESGTYEESVYLSEHVNLTGVGGNVEIKGISTEIQTLATRGYSFISNVTITGGKHGLFIPKNSGPVTLSNCVIKEASRWGVVNEAHDNIDVSSLSIIGSKIIKNNRQGAYLRKSSLLVKNSDFSENGQEGLDLHVGMKSHIQNSSFSKNEEGGIETELGEINLTIENSIFEENGSSGINLQSSEDDSEVLISKNTIQNNVDFGIRCAIHKGFSSPYFSRMVTIEENNQINGNGKDQIDPNCRK